MSEPIRVPGVGSHSSRRPPREGDHCANPDCTYHRKGIPLATPEVIVIGDKIVYCSEYCWDEDAAGN